MVQSRVHLIDLIQEIIIDLQIALPIYAEKICLMVEVDTVKAVIIFNLIHIMLYCFYQIVAYRLLDNLMVDKKDRHIRQKCHQHQCNGKPAGNLKPYGQPLHFPSASRST